MTRASEVHNSIAPGANIANRFEIQRLLGRGSMGYVWLAKHLSLNVDVAVKFIDGAIRHQDEHRERFAVEARTAAQINSPHVVKIFDFGTDDDGRLFLAMEYLDGADVERLLAYRGRLPLGTLQRVVAHACSGLAKAHALGIVHRDIKPENLFVCGAPDSADFVVKILDFGVAKAGHEIRQQFRGTQVGQLVGSPAYMSPEQARGSASLDARSDLFSLAVVAYHCLTGQLPFNGTALPDLLVSITHGEPAAPSSLVPELPPLLDEWFERALAKQPHERFQSASEMAKGFFEATGSTEYRDRFTSTTYAASAHSAVASRSTPLTSSNITRINELSGAIEQVAGVTGVLGVALLSPDGDCLAHASSVGMEPPSFSEMVRLLAPTRDTFDVMDASHPSAMGLHFESAIVLIRWIESYPLVVVGVESVHPTVLTLSVSGAAARLVALARDHGGPARAFRSTLSGVEEETSSGIVSTVSPEDLVPDDLLAQTAAILLSGLGPRARLEIHRAIKRNGSPTFGEFPRFVDAVARSCGAVDETTRVELVEQALAFVPPTVGLPELKKPVAPPGNPPPPKRHRDREPSAPTVSRVARGTVVASSLDSAVPPPGVSSLPLPPSSSVLPSGQGTNEEPLAPKKAQKTYVYRGKVYKIDG